MKNLNRNVRISAENNGKADGFNIFLDFSGRREYLMYHRHNGLLYDILKDGVAVDDIKRWKPYKLYGRSKIYSGGVRADKVCSMVKHLITVVDEFIEEREAC